MKRRRQHGEGRKRNIACQLLTVLLAVLVTLGIFGTGTLSVAYGNNSSVLSQTESLQNDAGQESETSSDSAETTNEASSTTDLSLSADAQEDSLSQQINNESSYEKENVAFADSPAFLSSVANQRTIKATISWGDIAESDRPQSIRLALYGESGTEPVTTFQMTAANEDKDNAAAWTYTLPDTYPICNSRGEEISYRLEAEDTGNCTVSIAQTEQKNLLSDTRVYVPVDTVKDGENYLIADGTSGSIHLYAPKSSDSEEIRTVDADMISGLAVHDTDGNQYDAFLAVKNPDTDEKTLHEVLWKAHVNDQNQVTLSSEAFQNLESDETTAENDYPNYLSLSNDGISLVHDIWKHAEKDGCLSKNENGSYQSGTSGSQIYLLKEITMPAPLTDTAETDYALSCTAQKNDAGEGSVSASPKLLVQAAAVQAASTTDTSGKRTITISKTWDDKDDASKRPSSVGFLLYTDDPAKPLTIVTLTSANAVSDTKWEYTLPDTYPVYDSSGNQIEYHMTENMTATDQNNYRVSDSSVDTSLETGYSGASVYVPVSRIEDGTDYLVADGNSGQVKLYRAEAYQTNGVISTADGAVSVINSRTLTGEDGSTYSSYILLKDTVYKVLGSETVYDTDYMTWRAHLLGDQGAVFTSNAYRLWGLEESGNENQYPGYLTNTAKGLSMTKSDFAAAGSDSLFQYQSSTGGFKTESGQTVYLYKKVNIKDGLEEKASTTFNFTNYHYTDVMDGADDNATSSVPDNTVNIDIRKKWGDTDDHTNDTVTAAILADGKEVRQVTLNAKGDWKSTVSDLPRYADDGTEIKYSLQEISALDNSGKDLGYQMASASADDAKSSEEKFWLPVDRPEKSTTGAEYVVICWPNDVNGSGSSLTDDGSGSTEIVRTALTASTDGTKYALGSKNAKEVGGTTALGIKLQTDGITIGGKTYASYIKDQDVTSVHKWIIQYAGQGKIPENGSYVRDLYTFKSSIGGYLSTQGAMTLERTAGDREKFAYGFPLGDSNWPNSSHLSKQGYTKDQVAHMIGAMDHYTLRTNQSPGGFNDEHNNNTGLYLYRAATVKTMAFTLTNEKKATTALIVNKEWKGDTENSRPDSITFELYRNGIKTGITQTVTKAENWVCTFQNLEKTDSTGNLYQYTVKEVSVPSAYQPSYSAPVQDKDGTYQMTVTNTLKQVIHMPESGGSTAIHVAAGGLFLLIVGFWICLQSRRQKE